MNPVALIIRRNLLGNRAIAIPSFGTLMIRRVGAGVTDGGLRIASPYRQLVVNDQEAVSIIDYIMEELEVTRTQATLQYNLWIDESIEGEYLIIAGVGAFEIAGANIELDEQFASLLNPAPDEKIIMRRGQNTPQVRLEPVKENNTFWVIMAIVAALGAAAYLVYYFADDLLKLIE